MLEEDGALAYYLTSIHDPCFADCPSSHLGIPVAVLPIEAVTLQGEDDAQLDSCASLPVVRWDEDSVAVSEWFPLDHNFPALVLT